MSRFGDFKIWQQYTKPEVVWTCIRLGQSPDLNLGWVVGWSSLIILNLFEIAIPNLLLGFGFKGNIINKKSI